MNWLVTKLRVPLQNTRKHPLPRAFYTWRFDHADDWIVRDVFVMNRPTSCLLRGAHLNALATFLSRYLSKLCSLEHQKARFISSLADLSRLKYRIIAIF